MWRYLTIRVPVVTVQQPSRFADNQDCGSESTADLHDSTLVFFGT